MFSKHSQHLCRTAWTPFPFLTPFPLRDSPASLDVAQGFGFSYYDSLIVAAAQEAGCDTVYSEDLQHGQAVDPGLTVVNPLLAPVGPSTTARTCGVNRVTPVREMGSPEMATCILRKVQDPVSPR
jgi:hypothetical protein